MAMREAEQFDTWGIVELMGRLKVAGRISEQVIAGSGMIRVDVPETSIAPAFTRYFAPSALYGITPTTEVVARRIAATIRHAPVTPFELRDSEVAVIPTYPHATDDMDDMDDDFEP